MYATRCCQFASFKISLSQTSAQHKQLTQLQIALHHAECDRRSVLQFIVGFPLILPVKLLHAPSIFAYKSVSQGNGMYVGATITAIFSVVMMTCIYEAFTLHQKEHESDSKCAPWLSFTIVFRPFACARNAQARLCSVH
jgi:hypothetical protein